MENCVVRNGARMTDLDSTKDAELLPPLSPRRRALRIVYSPDESAIGKAFELDGSAYVFGRAVEGKTHVADGRMSREHAAIRQDSGGYVVFDLGSKNGTFVQGRRVSGSQELLSGHVLTVGETLFVVDQEPELAGVPAGEGVLGNAVFEWIGSSFAADRVRRTIATVARTKASVLLLGETGTGKEVAAQAIHRLAGRGHLVAVNCGAFPEGRAEAELFGWKKGAFSGAERDHDGFVVQADGGTLFLDEIGDLRAPAQAALLRTLQDGSVQPIGGTVRQVDVRVIAATRKELEEPSFRQDLRARLSGVEAHLPALRDRRADILDLFRFFSGKNVRPLGPLFAEALLLYGWPNNVREIRLLAESLPAVAQNSARFELTHLEQKFYRLVQDRAEGAPAAEIGRKEATLPPPADSRPARALIVAELEKYKGNVQRTAQANEWHATQLRRWIEYDGIDLEAIRSRK